MLDSVGPIPGYFDSPWPAECGGPRRQRIPRSAVLIAADGRLIMKNIERDADRLSTLVVLDPDRLEQTGPETPVPENSMGRIAATSARRCRQAKTGRAVPLTADHN